MNITISLTPNEPSEENVKKESHKARSLIAFPENYVVVDLETTGISADYDDIIEFGAVKVINNVIVDELSVLCNPGYEIDEYTLTKLTQKSTFNFRQKKSKKITIDDVVETLNMLIETNRIDEYCYEIYIQNN